jgi:hypothetical protein
MTDRGSWLEANPVGLNIRRLMYQTLMWARVEAESARRVARDHAGGLSAPLDAEDVQGAANALVDGMRGNVELGGDFLGRKMLLNQAQAIELPGRQPGDTACRDRIISRAILRSGRPIGH